MSVIFPFLHAVQIIGKVGPMGPPGAQGEPCREANPIAFSAARQMGLEVVFGLAHTLTFDQMMANEGGAFHPISGTFTCPQDGLYLFTSVIIICLLVIYVRSTQCLFLILMTQFV